MQARLCVGLCVALAACQPASAEEPLLPPPPAEPPPARVREHDAMVRLHMHENFDLLRAIEKLLIRGKLDEARTLAKAIAQAPDEPGLAAWAKQTALVRERAAALSSAKTLADALRREVELADACAGCHTDSDAVPDFGVPKDAPPDRSTIEARMARHLWATDRLWEAMVGLEDESWSAGLAILAAAPLADLPASRARFGRQLQQLANAARKQQATATRADRVRAYGEMLATCAACHMSP